MLSYCLKCRKKAETKRLRVAKTKKRRPTLLSKCALCGTKKQRFIKEQQVNRFLEDIGKAIISLFVLFGETVGKTFAS